MILAEQGHEVVKWWVGHDPTLELNRGDELWAWLQHGKLLEIRHARAAAVVDLSDFDLVIDNLRADTMKHWEIDAGALARKHELVWVSLRADDDARSFDVVAQARAWGDLGYLPFYIGDTSAGLWLAFKALAAPIGHHVIRQANVLAKLVEGELIVDRSVPWDEPGTFGIYDGQAVVEYRGERIVEPVRDLAWRRENLRHVDGRLIV
jgi:hypothetical protein